jgi:4-amino-4-deoxy-L-arabinose transferase-like glycosyltransferase
MKVPGVTHPKYFFIIILLAIFFSFWKLGAGDLHEWDESEYGVNAFEMLHNGDYINYYYAGQMDTWNAKPPLSIWLITICYRLFGYNAFALRFMSAISSVIFFIFSFKLIRKYAGDELAFVSCLILLSCKAIVGIHIGRTGDTDALLVCLLTISLYYFLLFADFDQKNKIFLSAIFAGIAFYAKGMAAFILIPGLMIYLIAKGNIRHLLKDRKLWISVLIFLSICMSWIVLLYRFGNQFDSKSSVYRTGNAIETLFSADVVSRLTDSSFGKDSGSDKVFFFRVLDTRFNIWNYFFYLSVILGIFSFFRKRKRLKEILADSNLRLIFLSICISFPVVVILTFATSTHNWYLAPVFLFIAVVIASGILEIRKKINWFIYVFVFVLIFNMFRQFTFIDKPELDMQSFFKNNKDEFLNHKLVQVWNIPNQNIYLYLNWYSTNLDANIYSKEFKSPKKDELIFLNAEEIEKGFLQRMKVVSCYKKYCLVTTGL